MELLAILFALLPFCLLGFFWPGCPPCCESCEYFSDDFNRANDTNLGANYTESAGSWSITSNRLVTSSTSAICLLNTPHPDGTEESKVVVQATGSNSGNLIRIILDYVDTSNYHFAEWQIQSGGYLRIYRRLAGTNTQLATVSINRTAGVFYEFIACIRSGVFRASVGVTPLASSITPHGGEQVGVATGGTLTGSVTFDDCSASVINDDCPCLGCCVDVQTQLKFTLSLFTGGGCCNDYHAAFILDFCVTKDGFGFTTADHRDVHYYILDITYAISCNYGANSVWLKGWWYCKEVSNLPRIFFGLYLLTGPSPDLTCATDEGSELVLAWTKDAALPPGMDCDEFFSNAGTLAARTLVAPGTGPAFLASWSAAGGCSVNSNTKAIISSV